MTELAQIPRFESVLLMALTNLDQARVGLFKPFLRWLSPSTESLSSCGFAAHGCASWAETSREGSDA